MNDESPPFQILSLSGGGVRGLYTISVLAELETYLAEGSGNPDYWIGQHFDLISGTSIGGILGLALASGVTARQLQEVLDTNRKSIFPKRLYGTSWFHQLVFGKYNAEQLRKVISDVVGDKTLGEVKTRVLVPAINASTGLVQTFKTPHHVDFRRDWKYKVVDIALATSAAPTYFPPHKIDSTTYVDGGLAANSPALMAFHEARYFLGQQTQNIRLVSVGTMGQAFTRSGKSKRTHGYWSWGIGKDLISMSMSSTESLHNQITGHLLPETQRILIDSANTPDNSKIGLELDNASDKAADVLKAQAQKDAQYKINDQLLKAAFTHVAPTPSFYHGPQKNVATQESDQ
ncbi:CBASS cGAMP-activated phospholipase [Oceanospirillum maris]|uniref:CBASS cGAMP-activated phospholipase n=1 Tax=Oceanospirillum maris TaxID=64977 RepID=UPI000404DD83|nr:CBASS cGAMP-activated phospholipase [Oceanospirillum maris]